MKQTTLAFALCLAACGGDNAETPDGNTIADAAAYSDGSRSFATQVMRIDCAPNDGPALRLLLAESVTLECTPDGLAPTVDITMFVGSVTPPETIVLGDGIFGAWAVFCPGGLAPCLNVQAGEVHFDTFEAGQSASGTWRLLVSGTEESGPFDATWCAPATPVLCG